jgi:hypothetical protein
MARLEEENNRGDAALNWPPNSIASSPAASRYATSSGGGMIRGAPRSVCPWYSQTGPRTPNPKIVSDNELTAFVLAITSGCGVDDRATELHRLWPMLGLNNAKMTDAAYVEQVMEKYSSPRITSIRRRRGRRSRSLPSALQPRGSACECVS